MLSHSDADLVRRDSQLPGLATLLDPEAFVSALGTALPEQPVGPARVTYVRYKPGTSCLVGYSVEIAGVPVSMTAAAHRPDAIDKLAKARERHVVLDDRSLIVAFFPNDDRLPALRLIAEPNSRRNLLRKVLPGRDDLWDASMDALRYKPERRFVARLSVDGIPRAVLKAYTRSGFDAAQANAKALATKGSIRLATRLSRSTRHNLLVLEWLPGRLLAEALADPMFAASSVECVGAALAGLHSQKPKRLLLRSRADEAAGLPPLAEWVAHVCPMLAARTRRLAGQIAEQITRLPVIDRPLHGDFYAKQVLLDKEAIGFIDFDEAHRGDPAYDLGLFLAHLESDALRGRMAPERVGPIAEALLEGYQLALCYPVSADRVALYTAAGLLRLAPHPFRNREPGWPERTAAVVERAETLLSTAVPRFAGTSARNTPVFDPLGVAADPAMPFLAAALCPTEVEREFGCVCGPAHVQGVRVIRYKPGRRSLIAYDLLRPDGTPTTLVGKARAKGADRRAYAIMQSLRDAGFDEQSPDGIAVPEPLGVVPAFGMWLQREVRGVPATQLLAGADGIAVARRIADAACKLHRSELFPMRHHSVADELHILDKLLGDLAHERSGLASRLDRLRDRCHRLGASIPQSYVRPIHRDFYPDQVLIDGPRLYLLDFDLLCGGDPALDIGNFVGHVTEQSLRQFGDADALADRERALTDRYVILAGHECRPAISAYTVLTLARHVALSTRFSERRPFTERLLSLCEERLEEFHHANRRTPATVLGIGGLS